MKIVICILGIALLSAAQLAGAESSATRVRLKTNYGDIILELNSQSAPTTVENFLGYVRNEFYNGMIFHRVIKGFMIQGGGFTPDMKKKAPGDTIQNEADNGLKNLRGTIAMARTQVPHSATSQFFINTVDNTNLDHKEKTPQGWGYCVFGKVVEGMDVVDTIEKLPTTMKHGHRDVPSTDVIIEQAIME